jgi:hypothetical protein
MKKAIFIFLLALNITPAYANEVGGWVKVNASGAVVSGTIVCTPDVCGDPNSPFSKDTLAAGESYVQIVKANSAGNVAGPSEPTPEQKVRVRVNTESNLGVLVATTVQEIAPGVNATTQKVTSYDNEEFTPTTITKETKIDIESPNTIKQDPAFLDWLNLIHQMFIDLFTNFTWAWDL